MEKRIKITDEWRDAESDPYRKLMEQLVREDELAGIIITTIQKDGNKLILGTRTCKGGDNHLPLPLLGECAAKGIIEAIRILQGSN